MTDLLVFLTAADKVNDLDPVTLGDGNGFPIRFSNDVSVQFDRDPLGRHRKKLQQCL